MYIYEFLVLVVTIVRSVAGGGSGDGPNVQIPRYNNVIPTSCRDVVFKEAKNPLACTWVTRKQIGQEGLLNLDPYHWAKVSQLSQDKYTGDNVYNDLLMSVVATPTEAPGTPNAGDQPAGANLNGAKQNPTLEHADKPLNPDNLPGACRYPVNLFILGCQSHFTGGTTREVTRVCQPVCALRPSKPAH